MRAGHRPTPLVIVRFTIVKANIENHCTAYPTHLAHNSDGIRCLAKCVLSSCMLWCWKHVSVSWVLAFLAAKLRESSSTHAQDMLW